MGVIHLDQPTSKGRKRRKIKSAAWVLDDSPKPEDMNSTSRSLPANVATSKSMPQIPIKLEPDLDLTNSILASPGKRSRGRPPRKKKPIEETNNVNSRPSEVVPPKQKRERKTKTKATPAKPPPSEALPELHELQYPPDPHPVKQELHEESIGAQLSRDPLPSMSTFGLRRSQRIPKPRIKKEIEEFTSVSQLPVRRPRVVKPAADAAISVGAQSAPAYLANPAPEPNPRSKERKSTSTKGPSRPAKVKMEPIDMSMSVPGDEKVFIRISAEKIRQIAIYPPTFEIDY